LIKLAGRHSKLCANETYGVEGHIVLANGVCDVYSLTCVLLSGAHNVPNDRKYDFYAAS
jgi:hypothetical protein